MRLALKPRNRRLRHADCLGERSLHEAPRATRRSKSVPLPGDTASITRTTYWRGVQPRPGSDRVLACHQRSDGPPASAAHDAGSTGQAEVPSASRVAGRVDGCTRDAARTPNCGAFLDVASA